MKLHLIVLALVVAETAIAAPNAQEACDGCHGADGNAPVPTFPKLAGLDPDYVYAQLQKFVSHTRSDETMTPAMEGSTLTPEDVRVLSRAYVAFPRTPIEGIDPKLAAAGKVVYERDNPLRFHLSCENCHGEDGEGIGATSKIHAVPGLAKQNVDYLVSALKRYKAMGNAANPVRIRAMTAVASALSDEEIEAVANYAAGL